MKDVLEKLNEIDIGEIGLKIYSTKMQNNLCSLNGDMSIPLASAAKVAIGFCIAKWVEEELFNWETTVENIKFNPKEDSKELYPHYQHRTSLQLKEAVEVMIACHDSIVAESVVNFCGGWDKLNIKIQSYYSTIYVTEDPTNYENKGQLDQILDLMICIFQEHKKNAPLWTPIISGLIRQKGDIEGIPTHFFNHITGGLENIVIDIGIIGDFNRNPYIFALGAKSLPSRFTNQDADHKITEAMKLLYTEYSAQYNTDTLERR